MYSQRKYITHFQSELLFCILENPITVLKYADAVLKGYATAISVILTGMSSMVLFGTKLNTLYFLGIGNVICAVLLYSSTDLDKLLC